MPQFSGQDSGPYCAAAALAVCHPVRKPRRVVPTHVRDRAIAPQTSPGAVCLGGSLIAGAVVTELRHHDLRAIWHQVIPYNGGFTESQKTSDRSWIVNFEPCARTANT